MSSFGTRCLAVLSCCIAGCASPLAPLPTWTATAEIDGVSIALTALDPNETRARAALVDALDAAREVAGRLLISHRGSEVDVLVHIPSHIWIEVSKTTGVALRTAFDVAERTDGAYDPTTPPLEKLWGLRPGDQRKAPRSFEVETMLRRVDFTDIELEETPEAYQVRRLSRRTELDLGALGRGAVLDAALTALRDARVPAARASTSYEHTVYSPRRGAPWSIELAQRGGDSEALDERVGSLELSSGAVAIASRGPTSRTPDGRLVHDRFDARTGYPATGSEWVMVMASNAARAGAWADAIFALGREGRAKIEEDAQLRAIIQRDDGELWASKGVRFTPSAD